MKVIFYCGYYSDRAHRNLARRTEDYWNAYFYVWAVKIGTFKKGFYIVPPDRITINITKDNFNLVRETFGKWAAEQVPKFSSEEVTLISVPSKDALAATKDYRSLKMTREVFAATSYADKVSDGLRWSKEVPKAHAGGERSRAALLQHLKASTAVKGKSVILIDDLFSTGGSLLAASDCLTAADAKVLGAITCGKTVYDFNTPAFGTEEFELSGELADWPLA
jgi:Phosphoribosyl transferase domain